MTPLAASSPRLRLEVATKPFVADWKSEEVPAPIQKYVERQDDGRWCVSVPGLLVYGGRLLAVLPRCYGKGPSLGPDSLHALRLTVGVFWRYFRNEGSSVDQEKLNLTLHSHGDPANALASLEVALALWSDYQQRGRLTITETRRVTEQPGRIHWPDTIRAGAPVGDGSSAVLRQLVKTRVQRDPLHELAQLHHQTCVNIGSEFSLGFAGLHKPISAGEALKVLERNARRCFADRHKLALGNLTKYYRSLYSWGSEAKSAVHVLFAKRFEYVWERMLQVALGHAAHKKDQFKGSYELEGVHLESGLDLRPDLLVRTRWQGKPVLMVLDAKDYDYDSWPGSADITKQILYRLLVSDRIRSQGLSLPAIGNAFLFPSRRASPVECVGTHNLKARALQGLGRVVGLEVDYQAVADAYLSGQCSHPLVTSIREHVMPAFAGGSS